MAAALSSRQPARRTAITPTPYAAIATSPGLPSLTPTPPWPDMDLRITGKTVLVTGSSRGIGRGIAAALVHEGCRVMVNGRDADTLAATARALGTGVEYCTADVTAPAQCTELVAAAVERLGGLEILVCNVGSGASVPPGQETPDEWRRMIDINLLAATNMVGAASEALARARGAIVCISSIAGLEAFGAPIAYSGAKAALNAFVHGAARPLAKKGVRINAVAPGNIVFEGSAWERKLEEDQAAVETMLEREVPLGRAGTPEEIGDVVAFLASPRASFITGSVIVADGGQVRS